MNRLPTSMPGLKGQLTRSRLSPNDDEGGDDGLPRVLVLLAAFNGAQWIGEQLDSILRQTGVDVRVVVGDDRSTDSTVQLVQRLSAADLRIIKVEVGASSGGAGQHFFRLIRLNDAIGFDFVAFSDQDDVWYPDKLRRAIAMHSVAKSAGYSSAVTAAWRDGRTRVLTQSAKVTESDFLFEGAGQGCTFVLSVQFYCQLREFVLAQEVTLKDVHFHDWAIFALSRAWRLGWVFDGSSSMRYRQHGGNDIGARASLGGITERLAKIRSGWYRKQLLAIAAMCRHAAPHDPTINFWNSTLRRSPGWRRRIQIARFCLKGGRRRGVDRTVLIVCALAGWI